MPDSHNAVAGRIAGLVCVIVLLLCLPTKVRAQAALRTPEEKKAGQSWDSVYRAQEPSFNLHPNAFLVDVAGSLEPGTALDIGMGQGRNALYLAQQGWQVTGFDISEVGVEQARGQAKKLGVDLSAFVQSDTEFDWGEGQWDLITVFYFPRLRQSLNRIRESLKPGGVVIVEAYHADAALDRPPGPGRGVTFDTNELLTLFSDFRVFQYQDVRARADWGLHETRLVRLTAQKIPQ